MWLHEAIINTEMRLDGIRLNFNDSFVANWCSHSSRKKKTWETNRRKEIGQEIRTKANEVKQGKACAQVNLHVCRFLPSPKHGHIKICLAALCASAEHVRKV